MNRLVPVTLLALLSSFPTQTSASPQEPPIVANDSKGSMRKPPELVLQATPGLDGPEETLLYEPGSLFIGPDDRVYVADRGRTSFQVYDRDGDFLFRFGSKGGGPGEFQIVQGLYRNQVGELVSPDPLNRRINYYSADGEFLRSHQLNDGLTRADLLDPVGEGEFLRRSGGLRIIMTMAAESSAVAGKAEEPRLIEIVDAEDRVVRKIGAIKPADDASLQRALNNVLTVAHHGKIAAAFICTNDIRVYDAESGALERVITRELPFDARVPEVKKHKVEFNGRTTELTGPVTDDVTRALAYDPAGRLWVITCLHGTDRLSELSGAGAYDQLFRLEIYAPSGRLLAILPMKEPATWLTFDRHGDLWLLDSQYYGTVRRFEVRWP